MKHNSLITMKQQLLVTVLASMASTLFGCGGTSTVKNPPPSQGAVAPPIKIDFQSAPPSGPVQLGQSASLSAVVSNDPNNLGVDWIVSCQVTDCGSFSSSSRSVAHSASGETITYFAPTSLEAENQSVTITALATSDHTKTTPSALTVIGYEDVLTGTFVLGTNGSDPSGNVYQRVGAIVLDGHGGITSGYQTVNFANPSSTLTSVNDRVTGGSYSIGFDGRGTLTIKTNDVSLGQQGTETFRLIYLSKSQALLTQLGDANEFSVGSMDMLETSTPVPVPGTCIAQDSQGCGYAFVAGGADVNKIPLGLGGIVNIDFSPAISPSPAILPSPKSVLDEVDIKVNDVGVVNPKSLSTGTISSLSPDADAFGVFQISLSTTDSDNVTFAAYPYADGTRWKLIETDAKIGFTLGDALPQFDNNNNYTGTFHMREGSFPSGTYVFGLFGRDLSRSPASLAAAGRFSADNPAGQFAAGCCYLDESQAGNSVEISDSFRGTYGVGPGTTIMGPPTLAGNQDEDGIGRFYIAYTNTQVPNFHFGAIPGAPPLGTGPAWVMYATGLNGQGPVVMLDADTEPCLFATVNNPACTQGGGVATGIAYPVPASPGTPLFGGQLLGAAFTQNLQGHVGGAIAEISVDGMGSLSGAMDGSFVPNLPDTSLSGKFQADAVNPGRWTGTLADNNFTSAQCEMGPCSLSMSLYPIDQNQGFFVETDLAGFIHRIETKQSGDLTYGRYFLRTPVCTMDESHPVPCP